MFAYCNNDPTNNIDRTGTRHVVGTSWEHETSFERALSFSANASRPPTGEPGSTYEAPNGDRRRYGPDGTPEQDYDHDDHGNPKHHPHDENGGHYHDWKDGERGPAHLINRNYIVGGAIVTVCVIGLIVFVGNDSTGIGVVDDFLIIPLNEGIQKGLNMITGG